MLGDVRLGSSPGRTKFRTIENSTMILTQRRASAQTDCEVGWNQLTLYGRSGKCKLYAGQLLNAWELPRIRATFFGGPLI